MSDDTKRWRCQGHHTHWDDTVDTSSEPAVVEAPTEELARGAYVWHGYLSGADKFLEIAAQPVGDKEALSPSRHWELTWKRSMGSRTRFKGSSQCRWVNEIEQYTERLNQDAKTARSR